MPSILNLSAADIQTVKKVSKMLSRLNLSFCINDLYLKSYWCRIALLYEEYCGTELHSHSFYELHMCLGGSCTMETAEQKIQLSSGKFILITPGTKHKILSLDGNYTEFVWGFSCSSDEKTVGGFLKSFEKSAKSTEAKCSAAAAESLDIIFKSVESINNNKYDIIKCQLYCIFKLIADEYKSADDDADFYKKNPDDHIFKTVKKFIYDNPSLNLSASEIALQCNISEKQLREICSQSCGLTVAGLKNKIKCEIISELLTESNLTLSEIAEKTGFSDEFTMNKFFKRNEGMPPGQYRKSLKR